MSIPEAQSAEILREWWLAPVCIDAFRNNCTGEVSTSIVHSQVSNPTAGLIYIGIILFFNANDVKSFSAPQRKWMST
jgi:hypothetical protein